MIYYLAEAGMLLLAAVDREGKEKVCRYYGWLRHVQATCKEVVVVLILLTLSCCLLGRERYVRGVTFLLASPGSICIVSSIYPDTNAFCVSAFIFTLQKSRLPIVS